MGAMALNGRSKVPQQTLDALLWMAWWLAEVPGDVVEAGAYRCGTTVELARAVAGQGKRVVAFDVFGGLPYGEEQGNFQEFADADFAEVRAYVKPYANVELVRGRHEETVPAWPVRSLSLVFIDSDFYSSHRVCLRHFLPMLSPGGVVVFDDPPIPEVGRAIEEGLAEYAAPRRVEEVFARRVEPYGPEVVRKLGGGPCAMS